MPTEHGKEPVKFYIDTWFIIYFCHNPLSHRSYDSILLQPDLRDTIKKKCLGIM